LQSDRKKEKKEQLKGCTFRPNLKLSGQTHQRSTLNISKNEEIRGVDVFIKRLQDAQQKKIEEAEAFLLPS